MNGRISPRTIAGPLLLLTTLTLVGCGGGEPPRPAEEIALGTEEVSQTVIDSADEVLAVVDSEATCVEWDWDREDGSWECDVAGLPYEAEIDLDFNGNFREFEFVVSLEELRQAAPAAASLVDETCQTVDDVEIETSIRVLDLLTSDPSLAELWGGEGVFVEFQCADGPDYEIDAFGTLVIAPDDDVDPPATEE